MNSMINLSLTDLQLSRQPSMQGYGEVKAAEDELLAKLPPRPFPKCLADPTPPPPTKPSRYIAHHELHSLSDKWVASAPKPSSISLWSQQHEEQQALLKADLDLSKMVAIEQYQQRIEQLEQDCAMMQERHEQLLQSTAAQAAALLEEKEARIAELLVRNETDMKAWRQQLHDKDHHYIQLIGDQEKVHEAKLQQLSRQFQQQADALQAKAEQEKDLKCLAEQARLEAKEDEVKRSYEKKLRKLEKLVTQSIERYREKELVIEGALNESRREAKQLKETIDLKEKHYKEHLHFQDKRLMTAQNQIDSVDALTRVVDTWRATAKDLATYVIRACATVGELPCDFLALQPQGDSLAKDVYADLTAKAHNNQDRYVNFTKAQHVAVSRSQLTRALRLSKVVHERVKAEVQTPIVT